MEQINMPYEIEYTEKSLGDLREIAQYLAEHSRDASFIVVGEIRDMIKALATAPKIGPVYEKRPRLRRVVAGKHLVFYEVDVDKERISIVRILHSARDVNHALKG